MLINHFSYKELEGMVVALQANRAAEQPTTV